MAPHGPFSQSGHPIAHLDWLKKRLTKKGEVRPLGGGIVFVHEPEKSQQPSAEGLQASLAASTVRHAKVRSFIMAKDMRRLR